MSIARVNSAYTFDNGAPEADAQLGALESFLDPITADRIAAPILPDGASCWELGAGGGSVARLMARAAGPRGRVVATDIDPSHLVPADNLTVARHDVRSDPPMAGPFDVIHARLVLLHLPERQRVLRQLTQALAPGGWLIIEEFDCTVPLRVLTAPTDAAAKLFQQVTETMLGILQERGADMGWAQNVHTEMAFAGLTQLDTITYSESWAGGSPGVSLHDVNSRQLESQLVGAGLSRGQLDDFRELTRDPAFACLSYQFVSTRGRRPLAATLN